MPDREKVMQWLETCVSGCEEGCPYEYKNLVFRAACKADLMRDALAMLKEQEPVMPKNILDCVWSYSCGECKKPLYARGFVYCPWCGRKVKWDE